MIVSEWLKETSVYAQAHHVHSPMMWLPVRPILTQIFSQHLLNIVKEGGVDSSVGAVTAIAM